MSGGGDGVIVTKQNQQHRSHCCWKQTKKQTKQSNRKMHDMDVKK